MSHVGKVDRQSISLGLKVECLGVRKGSLLPLAWMSINHSGSKLPIPTLRYLTSMHRLKVLAYPY